MRSPRPEFPYPETSWTLIERAAEDGAAVDRFKELYFPSVVAYMRSLLRTTHLDAEEVAHDFFADQIWGGRVLRRADPTRGPFRRFLKRCVHNYALDRIRRTKRERDARTLEDREVTPAPDEHVLGFELEWARGLLERSIEEARRVCERKGQDVHFEVFRRRFLSSKDVAPEWSEVAEGLEHPVGRPMDVRKARGLAETVVRHVRAAVQKELAEQTGAKEAADEEILVLLSIVKGSG